MIGLRPQYLVSLCAFFRLSIYTVDQRTPVNIFFTVDVVKWPLKLMSSSVPRYDWDEVTMAPERSATAVQNHRVRMQLRLEEVAESQGSDRGHVGGVKRWPPVSPESSLAYRWGLVTNVDMYLRPNCGLHCGVGIMLVDIQRKGDLLR